MKVLRIKLKMKADHLLMGIGIAVAIWLMAVTSGCTAESPILQAGAHSIDITPEKLPAIRNGGFIQRIEDEILDRLHARCFVFKSEDDILAIAVVDSCMIPRDVCNQAKELGIFICQLLKPCSYFYWT